MLAYIKILLASLATAAVSITPTPAQHVQGITQATHTAPQIGSASVSQNWAGYVASNGNYTSVSGTWTVPQATDSGHTSSDATWVGIGGVNNSDLIQSGTQNLITPSGQITTNAFYELLPNVSIPIPNVSVKPGDSVSVTISQSATNQWLISFKNNTDGQNYQTTVTYTSSTSSAEWIEEAPSNGRNTLPLDNFGSVSFTGGATTKNGSSLSISGADASPVTMVNNEGKILATPSALGNDGASFTITRSAAVSTSPIPGFDRDPWSWRRHGEGIGHDVHFVQRNWDDRDSSSKEPSITQSPTLKPEPHESNSSIRVFQFFPHQRHFGFRHF